ncbi:SEFIR domain-containing protein [Streptomyces hokutonensis]|uniref:SEFIR domain-containing protein n=1 Tax=Streptomyces hokutonensis TaxID=1306990 RepID=UPI00035FB894|nr:SEFIR domain-containing protein [Streptomyces hokutonensis]
MSGTTLSPERVFISYAHDDDEHVDRVREFWRFLRANGIDAMLDLPAGEVRQDWSLWMMRGIRDSRRVIVVASPQYRRRADGDALAGEGAGVQWEARLLRDLVCRDPEAALDRIVPVVLPGATRADLPMWLCAGSHTYYTVEEFTETGAKALLHLLTGQPYETEPALGPMPVLPPREQPTAEGRSGQAGQPATVSPPPQAFRMPDQKSLVDALMGCPALHQLARRHELLFLMGEFLGLGHAFQVPEDSDARTHLRALDSRIRRTTLTPDTALKAMYFALEEIAPDDIGTRRVRDLLVACGLVFGEA